MHYWNKDSLEGLASLAAGLAACEDFAHLAEYCRCREAGLRREAFASLNTFLSYAETWEREKSQDAVNAVLTLHFRTPGCHQFLAQPLMKRFVDPVLQRWLKHGPDSIVPLRWLAILRQDPQLLGRVLSLEPGDMAIRRMLIVKRLDSVDYSTHHLNEGFLIGSLDEALEELRRASDLIEDAADRESVSDLDREVKTGVRVGFSSTRRNVGCSDRPKGCAWCPGSSGMKVCLSRLLNLLLGVEDMFVRCLPVPHGRTISL